MGLSGNNRNLMSRSYYARDRSKQSTQNKEGENRARKVGIAIPTY